METHVHSVCLSGVVIDVVEVEWNQHLLYKNITRK
jgi:hypothetical protein